MRGFSEMLEGRAVVRETDMAEAMRSHVMELAYQALDLHESSDLQAIAHHIKQVINSPMSLSINETSFVLSLHGLRGNHYYWFNHLLNTLCFCFSQTNHRNLTKLTVHHGTAWSGRISGLASLTYVGALCSSTSTRWSFSSSRTARTSLKARKRQSESCKGAEAVLELSILLRRHSKQEQLARSSSSTFIAENRKKGD
ncbi:uncharacterized protein LOC115742048 isoform X1 [Rhodamnia argentea]|uniref:Uncharacterized protein LOC115742048 isoform X1 n=1 Tax=Rhodamnia argentea TaxID=178133 RepID=A0ABM3GS30_9MYRT|nr:uncharacterized protein LOC115742048 isoform X1 [Rhodamnia argentea]